MSQTQGKNFPDNQSRQAKPSDFQPYAAALKTCKEKKEEKNNSLDHSPKKTKQKVEIVEDKGVVTKIKVTCNCGEVIEIDCKYD